MRVYEVFLKLLNVSVTASWLVLAVAALRLVLKRAPKSVRCLMWALVGLRLVFPFSIKSAVSLIPSREVLTQDTVALSHAPTIDTGVRILDDAVNPAISERLGSTPGAAVTPLRVLMEAAGYVWLAGLAVMAGYFVVSSLMLRHRVRDAVRTEDGVYESAAVASPFVFGVIRPRIYMPSHMDGGTREMVLAHERAHIKRRDYLIKPLAFMILSVYWFNPVMWLAFVLLCRDIELACDERVLRKLGPEYKKPYSEAILQAVAFHRSVAACPVAFGEGKLKTRVKNVLSWRKPVIWITLGSLLVCAVLAVCFLTDPKDAADKLAGRYVLESGGAFELGGDFWLVLREDGTAQYCEGLAASLIGECVWELENGAVTLQETGGLGRTFVFEERAGSLVYDFAKSDQFSYVKLVDMAIFAPRGEGEIPVGAEAAPVGPEGYYICSVGEDMMPFYIRLDYGGTFVFYESPYSSTIHDGLWSISDGVVTLSETHPDGVYMFRFTGRSLEYIAEGSDKLYFGQGLPDGSIFYRAEGERVYRPTGTYVHKAKNGRVDATLTVNADAGKSFELVYTSSGREERMEGIWDNTSRRTLSLKADNGIFQMKIDDGGVTYNAEGGFGVFPLEDGARLERVTDEGQETGPEGTYVSEGVGYRLEIAGDEGVITDLVSGESVWRGQGLDRYALWNPYNDGLVLLRQLGRYMALDIRTGGTGYIDGDVIAPYRLGWYGTDWLMFYNDRELMIYTAGDGESHFDGVGEFYDTLFERALSSDGAMAEAAASALHDVFDREPAMFLTFLALREEDVQNTVAELLVYGAEYVDMEAFREKVEKYSTREMLGLPAVRILKRIYEGGGTDGVWPTRDGRYWAGLEAENGGVGRVYVKDNALDAQRLVSPPEGYGDVALEPVCWLSDSTLLLRGTYPDGQATFLYDAAGDETYELGSRFFYVKLFEDGPGEEPYRSRRARWWPEILAEEPKAFLMGLAYKDGTLVDELLDVTAENASLTADGAEELGEVLEPLRGDPDCGELAGRLLERLG